MIGKRVTVKIDQSLGQVKDTRAKFRALTAAQDAQKAETAAE